MEVPWVGCGAIRCCGRRVMISKCKSCAADIIWARAWKTKKWMPLNAARVNHGLRFIVSRGGLAYAENTGSGHESHYATCPDAKEHREEADSKQGKLAL